MLLPRARKNYFARPTANGGADDRLSVSLSRKVFPFLSGVVLLRKKVDVLFPFLFSKPLSLRCGLEAGSLLHVRRRLQSGRKRKSEKKNKQKYTKEKSWIETKLFSAE
jgi:hypothetical protein